MPTDITEAEQECEHDWHPCGWQMQPGDHNCSHLFNDVNTDPPFWKAIDQITPDHQLITYRCDNCGTMGSHLVDKDQGIINSTMPGAHVPEPTAGLSTPRHPAPPVYTFPTAIELPLTPSLPGL